MSPTTLLITKVLALGIIGMQVTIVGLLYLLFFGKKNERLRSIRTRVTDRAYLFAFLVALSGMLSSLYYSDVVGFAPCILCWWQRVFMYPQVFILGLALWGKARDVTDEILLLSGVGTTIGAYQYYGQMFNASALPCPATPGSVSCAVIQFIEFGYITIPMMSLTGFILIIVLMAVKKSAIEIDK